MNTTTRARNRAKTVAALQRLAADTTTAPTMRRAATLRLGRLRAATTALPTTTRATPPAPVTAPSTRAIHEAVTSFHALARTRTALHRKRRTRAEQQNYIDLVALMPATVPTTEDPSAWRNFVGQIDALLAEIKSNSIL